MTQLATSADRYRDICTTIENMDTRIVEALPEFMRANSERFTRIALNALRNPNLLACTQPSIIESLMQAAQLGLECDGVLGHGYLISYGDTCTFQLGYRGIIALLRRSGQIRRIRAICVYDGDEFGWTEGDADSITHRPSQLQDRHRKSISHVYAIAVLDSGDHEHICWSREQIDDHKRQYSKGSNRSSSPWKTAWPAMAQKTVLIQLAKLLPVDVEIQRIVIEDSIAGSTVSANSDNDSNLTVLADQATDSDAIDALEQRFSENEAPDSPPNELSGGNPYDVTSNEIGPQMAIEEQMSETPQVNNDSKPVKKVSRRRKQRFSENEAPDSPPNELSGGNSYDVTPNEIGPQTAIGEQMSEISQVNTTIDEIYLSEASDAYRKVSTIDACRSLHGRRIQVLDDSGYKDHTDMATISRLIGIENDVKTKAINLIRANRNTPVLEVDRK